MLGLATLAGLYITDHGRRDVPPKTVLRSDPAALEAAGEAANNYVEVAVVQTVANARLFVDHVQPGLTASHQPGLDRIAARYALECEPENVSPQPWTQPSLFVTGRQGPGLLDTATPGQ